MLRLSNFAQYLRSYDEVYLNDKKKLQVQSSSKSKKRHIFIYMKIVSNDVHFNSDASVLIRRLKA
jgi:hypothetical protein